MHGADAPGWAHWLEAALLAEWMRGSPWAYPAASVLHVLGLGLLLGSILAFDLRILVVDDGILSRPVGRLLLNLARTGFATAGLSGLPMLAADATHVAVNPAFPMKLALLAARLVNILVFHQFALLPARGAARPSKMARVCAGWLAGRHRVRQDDCLLLNSLRGMAGSAIAPPSPSHYTEFFNSLLSHDAVIHRTQA